MIGGGSRPRGVARVPEVLEVQLGGFERVETLAVADCSDRHRGEFVDIDVGLDLEGLIEEEEAAVVIGMLVAVSAIGRSGYTVAEGDNGTVVILKGRDGGFLFFDQTLEVESDIDVDELPPMALTAVREGQRFDAFETAELYLEDLRTSGDSSGS